MTANTAAALHEIRDTLGLSWRQMAELFGVSPPVVRWWAEGEPMNDTNRERLDVLLRRTRRLAYSPSDVPSLLRNWCAEARRDRPPVFRLSDTLDVADGPTGVEPYEVIKTGPMPEPTREMP